jgi:hypothetical protein
LDEKLGQYTYIHTHVCACMGNQGKKAVGVIVVFVFFVLVWDKACQVDVVSAGVCVLREKGCAFFRCCEVTASG